jgi:uncharacterized repeat protein (TIGR01451 family)
VPGTVSLIGQTDLLTLTATSSFDVAKLVVAQRSTSIIGAILISTKSVNNSIPRAGDRVSYIISYGNHGNGDASNLSVSDVLESNLRFVTGSSVPVPDSVSGQRLTWNLGAVPGGAQSAIVFQADVASNAIPGTEIHNIAALRYGDGPHSSDTTSSESAFITVQSGGPATVDVAPNQTKTGEPGDTVQFAFIITNTGPLSEDFNISATSTQGMTWAFSQDLNGNGNADPGEPAVTSTGLLQGGGQFQLVARAVLPLVPSDLTRDMMTLDVRSTTNSANFKLATGTTIIGLPTMTLLKVAAAPDPRSGSEISYAITYANNGHGQARGFVVTDVIPEKTTYVPGSARLNDIAKTDQPDGDEVTVSGGLVSVRLGTVLPGSIGTIQFRVRIQ